MLSGAIMHRSTSAPTTNETRRKPMSEQSPNQPSNWGRWGATDERGTLNLLTPAIVQQAAGLVKTGKVYSLAMPLEAEGPQWPSRHKTWRVTTFRNPPGERGSA